MGYSFKRHEAVRKGVRRVINGLVRGTLKRFHGPELAKAIHRTRKSIKQIRAVMRLVRKRLPDGFYDERTDWLRKAARELAPVRDAQVRAGAIARMRLAGSCGRRELTSATWQKELKRQSAQAARDFRRHGAEGKVRVWLKKVRSGPWRKLKLKGWDVIEEGLAVSYRAGRKAFKTAADSPTPENLHEWRKRVKDLWCQMRLLRPAWPQVLGPTANELEILSEYLGDHHDLEAVVKAMESSHVAMDDSQTVVREQLCKRQSKIAHAALELGARCYAEKTKVFTRILRSHWKEWRRRKGKESRNSSTSSKRRLA